MTTVASTTPSVASAASSAASSSSSSSAASSSASSANSIGANYNTFLTLLTTQLQNQDPLNPSDTTEFTNQLVLFSQDEQQINMNTTLTQIASSLNASSQQQAIGYIGYNITATGSQFQNTGSSQTLGYTLPSAAAAATMSVTNTAGQTVWSQVIDPSAGTHDVTFPGTDSSGNPLPTGTYTIAVNAVDGTGKAVAATTTVPGTVTGVETANGTTNVMVGDTAIPFSSIVSVDKPSS